MVSVVIFLLEALALKYVKYLNLNNPERSKNLLCLANSIFLPNVLLPSLIILDLRSSVVHENFSGFVSCNTNVF